MKRIVAVLFAAMIAAVLLFGLLLIGLNAWVNPGSVPPSNSTSAFVSAGTLRMAIDFTAVLPAWSMQAWAAHSFARGENGSDRLPTFQPT